MTAKTINPPESPFQWQSGPDDPCPGQPGPGQPGPDKPAPGHPGEPKSPEPGENRWAIDVPGLSRRQQSALPAVLSAPTIVEAARRSGVGESTLRRWLEEPRFRTALDHLRQDAYEIALMQVQALVPECLNIFARIAAENTDPVLRMRAARYLLNYGMKYREVDELHRKLRALEQAVEADKSTKPQL